MDITKIEDPNSSNTYISTAAAKGRGVFAKRLIKKGEIIERAPVLHISAEEWTSMETSILGSYVFDWGVDSKDAAIALGSVSLYNHSYNPNATLTECFEEGMMEVECVRDIEEGGEITINYNGEPELQDELWFDVTE